MKVQTLLGCVAVVALSFVIGCGGGGGSATTGGAGTGSTNSGGSNTGGSGGTVTNTVKAATLTSIAQKVQSLGSQSAIANSLPSYCNTLPGVLQASLTGDNNVGIVFKDGTWVTVFNNRAPGTPGDTLPYPAPGSFKPPALVRRPAVRGKRQTIPSSTGFRVMHWFGSPDQESTMNKMMLQKGYDIANDSDVSLNKITNLGSPAVTFLDTHGGQICLQSPTNPGQVVFSFGLMTNNLSPFTYDPTTKSFQTIPSVDRDPTTDALLASGQIGIGLPPVGEGNPPNFFICVPPSFLAKYWSFPTGSIMFNSVCDSFSNPDYGANVPYTSMLTAAGLGCFEGYDQEVYGGDAETDALMLMEGILGTHIYNSSVRGRAWNVYSYANYMLQHGYGIHTGPPVQMHVAELNDFDELSPGIQYAYTIDNLKELVLVGDFGSQTGTVSVNGSEVSLQGGWSSTKLTCNLSLTPGSGSFAGPIYVTVNNHQSNWVQLTQIEAKGEYQYTSTDSYLSGQLLQDINWDLYSHIVLQQYRMDPFGALSLPQGNSQTGLSCAAVKASTGNYVGSGNWSEGTQVVQTFGGSGPLSVGAGDGTMTSSILFSQSGSAQFIFGATLPLQSGTSAATPTSLNSQIYNTPSTDAFNVTLDQNYNIQTLNLGPINIVNAGGVLTQASLNSVFNTKFPVKSSMQEDINPSN